MITTPNATPAQPAKPERESWLQFISRTRNFSFSLLLHVLGVLVFGTIVLQRVNEDVPEFVSSEGIVVDLPGPSPDIDEPPVKIPEPAGGETSEIQNPQIAMSTITTSANSAQFVMNATTNINAVVSNSIANGAGKNGGPGGLGLGLGMGNGTKIKFMGQTVTAKDVVLVLDVSSSMINTAPNGPAKSEKTYEILEREACNLIRGLKQENKFGVVAFSKEAKNYQDRLVPAHSDEKARAVSWIKQMTPLNTRDPRAEDDVKSFHHGTRADLALKAAFDLNPDLIFFVSDGEPTGTTVEAVLAQVLESQSKNNKLIEIHTIAYLADGGQKFMKDLAAQNRGTFREVNPKDIK